jgi:tRNA-specific 2-thiouridylase
MKAISLFSGGLDSVIAVKLIADQEIDVIAMFIDTGFGSTKDKKSHLENMCEQIGAELKIVDIREQFISDILFKPKYGYGKNFNPCIDCHANMFRVGKQLMEKFDASFLISGEVIGQRPMSQRVDAMNNVLKLADADNLILRPLSAKLLKPTKPELESWVDRDKLLDISGRNREIQISLAKKWKLKNYESPGGGCLLTEKHFSHRLREFLSYDTLTSKDVELLKFGRHFRLPSKSKLVIGRDETDNQKLERINNNKFVEVILPIIGPYSLLSKDANKEDKILAAQLAITYAKSTVNKTYTVKIDDTSIKTTPMSSKQDTQKYFFNSVSQK